MEIKQVIKIQAVRPVDSGTLVKFVYKNIYLKSRWQVDGAKELELMDGMMANFMNVMAWNAAMFIKNTMIIQNIFLTYFKIYLTRMEDFHASKLFQ